MLTTRPAKAARPRDRRRLRTQYGAEMHRVGPTRDSASSSTTFCSQRAAPASTARSSCCGAVPPSRRPFSLNDALVDARYKRRCGERASSKHFLTTGQGVATFGPIVLSWGHGQRRQTSGSAAAGSSRSGLVWFGSRGRATIRIGRLCAPCGERHPKGGYQRRAGLLRRNTTDRAVPPLRVWQNERRRQRLSQRCCMF